MIEFKFYVVMPIYRHTQRPSCNCNSTVQTGFSVSLEKRFIKNRVCWNNFIMLAGQDLVRRRRGLFVKPVRSGVIGVGRDMKVQKCYFWFRTHSSPSSSVPLAEKWLNLLWEQQGQNKSIFSPRAPPVQISLCLLVVSMPIKLSLLLSQQDTILKLRRRQWGIMHSLSRS